MNFNRQDSRSIIVTLNDQMLIEELKRKCSEDLNIMKSCEKIMQKSNVS